MSQRRTFLTLDVVAENAITYFILGPWRIEIRFVSRNDLELRDVMKYLTSPLRMACEENTSVVGWLRFFLDRPSEIGEWLAWTRYVQSR